MCCGPLLQRHSSLGEQRVVLFVLHNPGGLVPAVAVASSPCDVLSEVILAIGCKELPAWGTVLLALLRRSCLIPPSRSLLSLEPGPTFFSERNTPVHCKCKQNYILTYG